MCYIFGLFLYLLACGCWIPQTTVIDVRTVFPKLGSAVPLATTKGVSTVKCTRGSREFVVACSTRWFGLSVLPISLIIFSFCEIISVNTYAFLFLEDP